MPYQRLFQASCSWQSEGLFGQSFSIALPIQALRGLPCLGSFSVLDSQAHSGSPWLGSYSVDRHIRHLKGHLRGGILLCSSVPQVIDGPVSLSVSCWRWHVGRGRLWWWLHPLHVPQQYPLASVAARLSPTGISHHNILLHISICLSTVNSSPHPGIVPQSLNSSSQPLHLPGDLCPCPGSVWLSQGLSDSHPI